MTVISSDVFQLGAVEQTGGPPPTTPSSPAYMLARLTGESLNFQPQTTISNELDPSGQLRDSILTGAQSTGSIEMELTKHPFWERMLQAVFRNLWATGTEGDGTGSAFTAVGANELIQGKTLSLFEIEKKFTPPTGSVLYHRFDQTAVDSMSIRIAPNAPITSSVALSGGVMTLATSARSGATYTDPGTKPVFTAPHVTSVNVGAVPMTLCFNSLTMNFNSNVRGVECIGTLGFKEQVIGRFEASIEGSCYLASNEMLQDLIDQLEMPVTVTLADTSTTPNQYTFFFPRCKLKTGGANAAGTGQDVVQNVSFQALYAPTWGFTVRCTRVIGT